MCVWSVAYFMQLYKCNYNTNYSGISLLINGHPEDYKGQVPNEQFVTKQFLNKGHLCIRAKTYVPQVSVIEGFYTE